LNLRRPWLAAALIAILAIGAQDAAAQQQVPLIELAAPTGDGWLYTTSESEAAKAAAAPYLFQRQPQPAATIWSDGFTNSRPLYRCRFQGHPSYLVTALPSECARPDMTLEGVLGSIATQPGPGLAPLHRFSIPGRGVWRVAFQPPAGYKDEGLLGWAIPPSASSPAPAPQPAPPAAKPTNPCQTSPRTPTLRVRIAAGRSRALVGSRTVRTRSRSRLRVHGRLTTASGQALVSAPVCVLTKRTTRGAKWTRAAIVTTNNQGRFSYTVGRGPSRQLRFVHATADGASWATLVRRTR
jgi:hypothetical protein